MLKELHETVDHIRSLTGFEPQFGIILGTGLGSLADDIETEISISYADIPHFPVSTVESHKGRLIFGRLSGKKVVAMQGRFHFYEGYSMPQVAYPVRIMKLLGVKTLLVSNASGALNPELRSGDLMMICDHINLQPGNPLIGHNDDTLGPRFPDMSQPYDRALMRLAEEAAIENNVPLKKGVYVSVSGPVLETAAEYKYMRIIGGDVVGMSTVPEIIAARHMGMACFGLSVVTDEGWHEELQPLTLEQVIAAARKAEPNMALVMKELLKKL